MMSLPGFRETLMCITSSVVGRSDHKYISHGFDSNPRVYIFPGPATIESVTILTKVQERFMRRMHIFQQR